MGACISDFKGFQVLGYLVFVILIASSSWASSERLDRISVQRDYRDGNFEEVTRFITTFQQRNPKCQPDDSLFIAKHLAVIYASSPATREKGKYWMYQMLTLSPSANLLDMFVSEDIDHLYDKIRLEFEASHPNAASLRNEKDASLSSTHASPQVDRKNQVLPRPISQGSQIEKEKSNSAIWWWAGGIAALASVGTVTYIMVGENSKPNSVTENPIILDGAGGSK
jgi:hypothetical protein